MKEHTERTPPRAGVWGQGGPNMHTKHGGAIELTAELTQVGAHN